MKKFNCVKFPRKPSLVFKTYPYHKPTQVDRSRRLRRAGELSLRNSANKLDVTLGDVLPDVKIGVQQTILKRLFNKNTGLCKLERGSIGAETCPVPEG